MTEIFTEATKGAEQYDKIERYLDNIIEQRNTKR